MTVIIEVSPAYATVTMAQVEVGLIRNALTEVVDSDDGQFASRMGMTREEARALIVQLDGVAC